MDYLDLGYNSFMENNPFLSNDAFRYSPLEVKSALPTGSVSMEKLFGEIITAMLADGSITTAKIADLAVTTAKILSLSADKITTGDLTVAVDVGSSGTGYVRIDGENNRILVNDGTNDRILIGYQAGGF